ncbi:MAG TPA: site-2 protease family protein [Solirubrobacteraceae bacterium]|nr:site-2 protease family protein [Solirubrobacteraceae bacterium]
MENNELGLPAQVRTPALGGGTGSPAGPAYTSPGGVRPSHPADGAFGEESRARQRLRDVRRRIGSAFAAVAAVIAKFFAAIKGAVLLLPKVKLLTTAGTMLVSVVLYSLVFGWAFAIGFVVLLLVHEMGHVIQLRREGIRASAPVFIPFMGAVVGMKQMPGDALAEARVGLAGPILGSLGAGVCLAIALATGSTLLRAVAYVGFFLNLINLVPLTPFDGGRAMAAMAPAMWFVGLGVMVALLLMTHNAFLWIFVLFGGYDTYRRWRLRGSRSLQQAAYYRVSPRNRALVGVVYVALVVALVLGMRASEVLRYGSHTFHLG